MITAVVRLALLSAFAAIPVFPAHATTVFSDGTFDDTDWELSVSTTGGSVTSTQETNGGNPGNWRRHDVVGLSYIFNIQLDANYDPSVEGAVTSIGYGESRINTGAVGIGPGSAPALVQNGEFYTGATVDGDFHTTSSTWVSREAVDLDVFDFVRCTLVTCFAGEHPDFTASGGVITFGYEMHFTTSLQLAGIDNWSITVNTINTVPEPSTIGLLAAGLFGLFWRKRVT